MDENVPDDHPVVLFDGVCNLCEGFVQSLIRRDPDAVLRFAPLQSPIGRQLLEARGHDADEIDSVVLIEGDRAFVRSTAALRAVAHLGGRYRAATALGVVPRPIRDRVYDAIAARRYAWFGRREQCLAPTPDIESRFLTGGPMERAREGTQ